MAVPALDEPAGLAIPPPEEWDVPIHCFRCQGEFAVPFASYRAGTVFRCPHCLGSFVPTLSMVRAVAEALERFHAADGRVRTPAGGAGLEVRGAAAPGYGPLSTGCAPWRCASAPGAPTKRRGFWSF
jgi:hypothetical protein